MDCTQLLWKSEDGHYRVVAQPLQEDRARITLQHRVKVDGGSFTYVDNLFHPVQSTGFLRDLHWFESWILRRESFDEAKESIIEKGKEAQQHRIESRRQEQKACEALKQAV